MIEYEYYVAGVEYSTTELNRYLGQGWEVYMVTSQHMGGENTSRGLVLYTLRREKKKNDR